MLKWLIITLIVLAGFMTILLGLGYLLNENEKSTKILKAQLEQEIQAERAKQERIQQRKTISEYRQPQAKGAPNKLLQENSLNVKAFQQIVLNNLTCVSKTQCQVAQVQFKNTRCAVAINNIGGSLLKKLNLQTTLIPSCPNIDLQGQLSCQQNICTLEP